MHMQRGLGGHALSRRKMLVGTGALAASAGALSFAAAPQANELETHGLSVFGDLKYPADFQHVDYVDPAAPKGGMLSHIGPTRAYNQSFLTFNSLNSYILKGDGAQGMELTFATLMASAQDEADAIYGALARAVRVSADRRSYRFLLRPQARFHDGKPIRADDVVFSLMTLKEKGHPSIAQMLTEIEGMKADDDATVTVRLSASAARDVPLIVATLPIFSRAYYAGRAFDESTLDVPLGSGPYKVGRFEPGRFIEFERVKGWWGGELPIFRGQYNFDVVRYEYYRDRTAEFEGFTAKNYLFREEFSSRIWATRYDFPAIRDGRVKRDTIADETPSGGQGWFINTRRPQFKDRRVREALIYAFDFEWTNKNIMYGSYHRTHSMFQKSDLMASGPPGAAELALLEPFRDKLPEEVFGEPFVPPVSDGSGQDRALLRKAGQLLHDAGWAIKDGKRVNAKGEGLVVEFLIEEPTFQPHHMPFIKNLQTLGVDATLRIVDPVQYRRRVDEFDFDLVIQRPNFSTTPGDALRNYFGSRAAAIKGSANLTGMADATVDALVERVVTAASRPELTAACRALDRVIRAGRYWIPHWYKASHWLAYWDVYRRPATKPRYGRGVVETWWYDREKAAKIERAG
jgi:microcin C transport system substrate-binding protein